MLVTIIDKKTAAATAVSADVTLNAASIVKLDGARENIKSMERVSNNLVIKMVNGDVITIKDFFVNYENVGNSVVVTDEDGGFWLIAVSEGQGDLIVSYSHIDSIEPLLIHDGDAALGIIPFLFGGAALAAIASDIGSDDSGKSAPEAPKLTVKSNPDGSVNVVGKAEPGSEVTVTFPDGSKEVVVAGPDGSFEVDSDTPQGSGDVVAVVTDDEGNTSPEVKVPFTDTTAPSAPDLTAVSNPDGTAYAFGKAEAGSTVVVTFPDGSSKTITAGADGSFAVSSDRAQDSGDVLAKAVDKAGNVGPTIAADFLDVTPPGVPQLSVSSHESGTTRAEGKAEAGSTVVVQFPDGSAKEVVVDAQGNYLVHSDVPQGSGEGKR